MNRTDIKGFLLIFVMCLSVLLSIQTGESNASPAYSYTDQELDNLLAFIALYPDPLLAQMLPASTYPAEIADAETWLNSGGTMSSIDGQNWDESVKAIAHYPNILKIMAENVDWTADLGDAFPSVIYIERWTPGGSPFITFGLGLMVGGWLSMDFDWGHHHVIYHGWNRPGWVNQARPHVQVTNVYINRSRPYINETWRHDASHGDPGRYRVSRPGGGTSVGRNARIPEIRGSTTTPPKPLLRVFGPKGDTPSFSNRGKESRGVISTPSTKPPQDLSKRPTIPAPSISQAPPQVRPARESVQPPKTPSVTFGGYRGDKEAREQSLRGQASRQSSTVAPPPAPPVTRGSTPERKDGDRGSAPAGKDDTKGKPRR